MTYLFVIMITSDGMSLFNDGHYHLIGYISCICLWVGNQSRKDFLIKYLYDNSFDACSIFGVYHGWILFLWMKADLCIDCVDFWLSLLSYSHHHRGQWDHIHHLHPPNAPSTWTKSSVHLLIISPPHPSNHTTADGNIGPKSWTCSPVIHSPTFKITDDRHEDITPVFHTNATSTPVVTTIITLTTFSNQLFFILLLAHHIDNCYRYSTIIITAPRQPSHISYSSRNELNPYALNSSAPIHLQAWLQNRTTM